MRPVSRAGENVIGPLSRVVSARLSAMSFICAILVVTIHTELSVPNGSWSSVFRTIVVALNSVAVPFFFATSGFLLAGKMCEPGWWKGALVKRVRSLIIPFYVWLFLLTVWFAAMYFGAILCGVDYGGKCVDLSAGGIAYLLGVNPFRLAPIVWFLRALFFCVVMSPMFAVLTKRMLLLTLLALFALFAFHESHHYADLEWKCFFEYFISLRGIFYFAFGVYVRRFVPQPVVERRMMPFVFSGILFAIMAISQCWLKIGALIAIVKTFLLLVMLWSVVGFAFDRRIEMAGALQRFSMPVYLCHMFFLLAIAVVVKACGLKGLASTSVVFFSVKVAVATAGSCVLFACGRRFAPRLTSFVLGGR